MASSVNEMEEVDSGTEASKIGVPVRSGKISLPARMTDLYQSYPGDKEGMVIADSVQLPEIVLTRPSIVSLSAADSQNKIDTTGK